MPPDPRWLAAALALAITGLAIAGWIVGTEAVPGQGHVSDSPFHLIEEKTIPAFFTGAVLAGAGLYSLLAGLHELSGQRAVWLAFGALLIFMGLDEVGQIHERTETWTGIDWQLLYIPVAAGAAFLWWRVVQMLSGNARAMMLGAAGAWLLTFVLEDLEYDGQDERVALFEPLAITEEVLEMVGAALFLVALVVALRRWQAADRQ